MNNATMRTSDLKRTRVQLRTTEDAKDMLTLAAALSSIDLPAFVLGAALDKAQQVLAEHATIALSRAGQAKLVDLLLNPTAPTDAMRELMAMPRLPCG